MSEIRWTEDRVPMQVGARHPSGSVPRDIHLRAYEVYAHTWGEQKVLTEGWCRGGFGVSEIIVYLYAATFPRADWHRIVDEAFASMPWPAPRFKPVSPSTGAQSDE